MRRNSGLERAAHFLETLVIFIVSLMSGNTILAQTATITRVAGTTIQGYSGDGGPALSAQIAPDGLAVDRDGNIYLAEPTNHVIRRIDARTNIISTYAGTGQTGFNGDGNVATSTNLNYPSDVRLDSVGNVYIVDFFPSRVLRVDRLTKNVKTVAGTGINGFSGDGGPAVQAQIIATSAAFDRDDNLYLADSGNDRIRRIDHRTGIITTVVGSGLNGVGPTSGPAAAAEFLYYISLAFGPRGAFYFSDEAIGTVRLLDWKSDTFRTIAGVYYGPYSVGQATYNGDGIPATEAYLSYPSFMIVDCAGDLMISDTGNYRIREIDVHSGVITTLAGTGTRGYSGDGGLANQAMLAGPLGLDFARDGSLYVADGFTVRRISGFTGTRGWDCRDERRYGGNGSEPYRRN